MYYNDVKIFLLIMMLFLNGCQQAPDRKLEASTGFMTNGAYKVSTIEIQAGPINLLGGNVGRLEIIPQATIQTFNEPKVGTLIGVSPVFRYTRLLTEDFFAFIELGAGPGYLDIRTREQGSPGFNFVDSANIGFSYSIRENMKLLIKEKNQHVSHAGLRGSRNGGINTYGASIGLEIEFK